MNRPIPISQIAAQLHRKNFPHRADELSYPQAKIAPTPPSTWSANKQLALLTVGRFLPFAGDCIAHMRDLGARFDQPHLAELRINGLIYKEDITARFHKMTPTGKRLAIETAEVVATQLGLHHIRERQRNGERGGAFFTKVCTCGWRTTSGVFAKRGQLSIDEQVAIHIADPEAWKRLRSVPTPALAAALDRIGQQFASPDSIDDATHVYGENGEAWPQINTPCTSDKAPTGQCEFGADPAICIHCGKRT